MLTPPPWHFSGDIVMVEYRVDPAAAAAFLPPELDPGPEPAAAAAVFAQWQWCSDSGEELDDPSRCQFGEFLLLLGCEYDGNPMARCPYAWVDQVVPLMRGWVQGMPKQFGVIHQSRVATVGRAGPRLAPGGRFNGVLSVHGQRVASAAVTLTEEADRPPRLHDVPLVHTRLFPAWDPADGPVHQLVASVVDDVSFSEIWTGAAELSLSSEDEDLAGLAPVEVGQGYVFSYSETLRHGRLLSPAS